MILFFTMLEETMVGINDTKMASMQITPPMDIPTIIGHFLLRVSTIPVSLLSSCIFPLI
jgi:hypothetical protein